MGKKIGIKRWPPNIGEGASGTIVPLVKNRDKKMATKRNGFISYVSCPPTPPPPKFRNQLLDVCIRSGSRGANGAVTTPTHPMPCKNKKNGRQT